MSALKNRATQQFALAATYSVYGALTLDITYKKAPHDDALRPNLFNTAVENLWIKSSSLVDELLFILAV